MKYKYKVITLFLSGLCFLSLKTFAFELKTPLKQGSLFYGKLEPNETLTFNDQRIQPDKDGNFISACPAFVEGEATFMLTTKSETKKITYPIQSRVWPAEIVNGLPPQKVTPSQENRERIASEAALLATARKTVTPELFPVCFQRPLQNFKRISSVFGAHRVLNGVKSAGHSGTDYAAPIGTPVFAPAPGIVRITHPDMFFSGKTILIDHGNGIFSSYSHLNDIRIKEGDFIKRGDEIGTIGTSGRSTGPHLHWTLSWHQTRVDPEQTVLDFPCSKEDEL